MKMKVDTSKKIVLVLAVAFTGLILAGDLKAQVQTDTSTTSGTASKVVTVERGEVVTVSGNDLVVKMEDGTLRHFPNVSESARVTVGGQQLGIHDLKPGMKLERTITTTTTPQTITTVQSVTGIVWHVSPPTSVVLTLEDGQNQSFKIPNGQKFNINGQMVDAFGLRKGMRVTATKVVEVPAVVTTENRKVTGTMAPPPPAPPADVPILVAKSEPTPAPQAAAASAAPAQLPKTASQWPVVGLLGLLFVWMSLGSRLIRKVRFRHSI
jgi:hypothetical protein